jgi:hypothetical protein
MARWRLLLLVPTILVLGCPSTPEEQRQAAVLTFLSTEPTPSSLAVLQPGAADKLREVEPTLTDEVQRDRVVKALVLIDDETSHEILVDLLGREPERTAVAFQTAEHYQRLPSHLDLLYGRVDLATRQQVFATVCWPSFAADDAGIGATCAGLWSQEAVEVQGRWLRLFTHEGPDDDPAPYEKLTEGAHESLTEVLQEVIERVSGGEVIPAEARPRLELSRTLSDRRDRLGGGGDHLTVPFEGGYVDVLPLDPDSDFGRTGNRLLADLPLGCAATWGAADPGRSATLEVKLNGAKSPPEVVVVGVEEADTPAGAMGACMAAGLATTHEAAAAPWIPRFGECRLTLRSMRGASWSSADEGKAVLSEGDLQSLAEALRESGTPAWRARLEMTTRPEPPLRDLGCADLGYCLAYVGEGWDDCAHWIGEVAQLEKPVDDVLRQGLRDVDPAIRALCRAALSVALDEEGLEEASKAPEPATEAEPETEAEPQIEAEPEEDAA